MNIIEGNMPRRFWEDTMDQVAEHGGEVPFDQKTEGLVKVSIGDRYAIFQLSYVATGVCCTACPTAVGYRVTKHVGAVLEWIGDHEAEHHGSELIDKGIIHVRDAT